MNESVPKITVTGNTVSSDAARPRHIADTCACWPDGVQPKAIKLLLHKLTVVCKDATAHTAMLALSIALMHRGKSVKAKLVEEWK